MQNIRATENTYNWRPEDGDYNTGKFFNTGKGIKQKTKMILKRKIPKQIISFLIKYF